MRGEMMMSNLTNSKGDEYIQVSVVVDVVVVVTKSSNPKVQVEIFSNGLDLIQL